MEKKKTRRVKKDVNFKTGIVTFDIIELKKTIAIDPTKLPVTIQNILPVFAIGHKVGDSYANITDPTKIYDRIIRVQKSLMDNKWNLPQETGDRVTVASIIENYAVLPKNEQASAKKFLILSGVPKEKLDAVTKKK